MIDLLNNIAPSSTRGLRVPMTAETTSVAWRASYRAPVRKLRHMAHHGSRCVGPLNPDIDNEQGQLFALGDDPVAFIRYHQG
jgi:hypothetical protein